MSEIFTTLFVDEIMIITGLIGALVASNFKFGFFAFGMAAQIVRISLLLMPLTKGTDEAAMVVRLVDPARCRT